MKKKAKIHFKKKVKVKFDNINEPENKVFLKNKLIGVDKVKIHNGAEYESDKIIENQLVFNLNKETIEIDGNLLVSCNIKSSFDKDFDKNLNNNSLKLHTIYFKFQGDAGEVSIGFKNGKERYIDPKNIEILNP